MKKKIFKLFLVSLFMCFCFLSISTAQPTTVIEKIKTTGILEVAIREDAVPLGYRDLNNNLSGLCLDFVNILRQKIRDELKQEFLTIKLYKSTLFNRFNIVENRSVDFECGPNSIQKTIDRNVNFSVPFFVTGTQFFTKQENISKFNFNGQLSNLTLGVLRDTTNQRFIQENYPLAKLQEFQGSTGRMRGIQAVQIGRIDAFVSDGILLLGEATLLGLSLEKNYAIIPQKPLTCESYGLLLPPNDPEWQKFINSTILQRQTQEVLKDWFGVVKSYVEETSKFCGYNRDDEIENDKTSFY